MYPNFLQSAGGPMAYLQMLHGMQTMGGNQGGPQSPLSGVGSAPGGTGGAQSPMSGSGAGGMGPLMMLSPMAAMFASGRPNIGLGMLSPALGIAGALGAFK